ncbi:hypothetical protein [Azospirillum palustre]
MDILAHRGWWREKSEKNSRTAFERCFQAGYGCELDVRDCAGTLVISHDPPLTSDILTFPELLKIHADSGTTGPIAINVKADGLQDMIQQAFTQAGTAPHFLFDMSVPDTLVYLRKGMRVFVRQSEYEDFNSFGHDVPGVWLDFFHDRWAGKEVIHGHLNAGRSVALVSPELHGRDHRADWQVWREVHREIEQEDKKEKFRDSPRLMLCTDFPDEAEGFFNE